MRKTAASPEPSQLSLMDMMTPSVAVQKPAATRKPPVVSRPAAPQRKASAVKPTNLAAVKPVPPEAKSVKVIKVTEKASKRRTAKETPVRVTLEPLQTLTAGAAVWKMSGKHGVAYVKDAALAGELLGVEPKKLAAAAMAVYCDKKGRPFAWQVRFDAARWDELCRRLA